MPASGEQVFELARTRSGTLTYHFRIHDEDGLWAECIELTGCVTQGRDRVELDGNMPEALNLFPDFSLDSVIGGG